MVSSVSQSLFNVSKASSGLSTRLHMHIAVMVHQRLRSRDWQPCRVELARPAALDHWLCVSRSSSSKESHGVLASYAFESHAINRWMIVVVPTKFPHMIVCTAAPYLCMHVCMYVHRPSAAAAREPSGRCPPAETEHHAPNNTQHPPADVRTRIIYLLFSEEIQQLSRNPRHRLTLTGLTATIARPMLDYHTTSVSLEATPHFGTSAVGCCIPYNMCF